MFRVHRERDAALLMDLVGRVVADLLGKCWIFFVFLRLFRPDEVPTVKVVVLLRRRQRIGAILARDGQPRLEPRRSRVAKPVRAEADASADTSGTRAAVAEVDRDR